MIKYLRHRILLCSQKDVVSEGGELTLNREGSYACWAKVAPSSGSTFTSNGATSRDDRDKKTHIITIRYTWNYLVSDLAWIYEARLKSPPRWFKILTVKEKQTWGYEAYEFDCRIIERSDEAVAPTTEAASPVAGLPPGVRL